MSLQVLKPYITVTDTNGLPYVGAQLFVYQPGTTALAAVFTDDGLSIPADNPATSDARGDFPRLYIAAGTYKLRAETVANTLIFEEDNIDTGLSAGTGSLPISRGGTGATTAAAARANLDVPSNSELTAISTTVALLTAAVNSLVQPPQGIMTLTSGAPVIPGDVISASSVFYTPAVGNLIPVWNGSAFISTQFTELQLVLNSNHVANNFYDGFVSLQSGAPTFVTGPAWNIATLGSGGRGAGAGTTELELLNGVYVNKYDMTARNGATTYTVLARQGTFVGSLYIDGTAGQITCHRTFGQSRKWGVSNAYNRKTVVVIAGDATTSWTYGTATIRASNGSALNCLDIFSCLPDEEIDISFEQAMSIDINNSASLLELFNGIGVNSTTAFTGRRGRVGGRAATSVSGDSGNGLARYTYLPFLGASRITALENGNASVATPTFYGTAQDMILRATWRA